MRKFICIVLLACMFFVGCQASATNEDWGSFTSEKTYSYDRLYYAEQNIVSADNINYVEISVYSSNNELIYSFIAGRASDFWGICWESDSYNIWIQSADIGVICYCFSDEVWSVDTSAIRPSYIISKYD